MKVVTLVSILFLTVSLYACSGGDGGNSNGGPSSASTTERIVYLADKDDEVPVVAPAVPVPPQA